MKSTTTDSTDSTDSTRSIKKKTLKLETFLKGHSSKRDHPKSAIVSAESRRGNRGSYECSKPKPKPVSTNFVDGVIKHRDVSSLNAIKSSNKLARAMKRFNNQVKLIGRVIDSSVESDSVSRVLYDALVHCEVADDLHAVKVSIALETGVSFRELCYRLGKVEDESTNK